MWENGFAAPAGLLRQCVPTKVTSRIRQAP
jgi:hypothetical protein